MDEFSVFLPDGRRLGGVATGHRDGPVVVVHDGYGSRLLAHLAQGAAHDVGVRLLAPDRPGFWASDPSWGDPLAGWPDDLAAMLDVLQVEHAALLAASAGTPFAVAAAVAMPVRVTRLAVVGPAAPIGDLEDASDMRASQRRAMRLGHRAPRLGGLPMRLTAGPARKRTSRVVDLLIRERPPSDAVRMAEPPMRDLLERLAPELFGDGRSAAAEFRALTGDWGHLLGRVTQRTSIWVGTEDDVHPLSAGRHLADRIPGAGLDVVDGAFLDLTDRLPEVLAWAIA